MNQALLNPDLALVFYGKILKTPMNFRNEMFIMHFFLIIRKFRLLLIIKGKFRLRKKPAVLWIRIGFNADLDSLADPDSIPDPGIY
jgi:hypothetical protein